MRPNPSREAQRRAILKAAGTLLAATLVGGQPLATEPAVPGGSPGDPGYVFGVFPYLPPLVLDRIFAPIVGALSRELGHPVHLRTNTSFEAFTGDLSVGSYDLAFMHPFIYLAAAGYGYAPLARVDEPLRMVFLTRPDSDLNDLGDLAGKTLALPGALAAVSEIAKLALTGVGLRPGIDLQLQHYQSKKLCMQALVAGDVAACGVPTFALAQMEVTTRQSLRIFAERALPAGLVIAAHSRVSASECARIGEVIVAWSASEEGRRILAEVGWPGFTHAADADFDIVRSLLARPSRLAQHP